MDFKAEIEKIKNDIKNKKYQIDEIKKQWIEKEHPLKIDSIATVTGAAHRGKQMLVNKLDVKPTYRDGWEWIARGYVLKKDGSPGFNYGEWTQKI